MAEDVTNGYKLTEQQAANLILIDNENGTYTVRISSTVGDTLLTEIERILSDAEVDGGGGLYVHEISELQNIYPTLHDDVILTANYAGNIATGVACSNYKELHLLIDYAQNQGTSLEIRIEYSHNNTDWFQETTQTYNAGVHTIIAVEHSLTASATIVIPLINLQGRFVRTAVKETGADGVGRVTVIGLMFGR